MIDELPTRAAMTLAAFALLATGLSVLSLAGGDAARAAAEDLAAHLARELDRIGGTDGSMEMRGGAGMPGAFAMPPELAGSSYAVDFRATEIRVVVGGGAVAVSALHTPIHPFPPSRTSYTSADLRTRDASVVSVRAGDAFVVERALRAIDAVPAYLTFVHLP